MINTCAQAQTLPVPVMTGTFTLPSKTDVDWVVLPATAANVGKKVHAVTASGETTTDTVVEVFGGSCAALNTLGGPSTDLFYHEDWLSAPITKAGLVYVKVSYSSVGYSESAYTLTVTYQ